MTSAGTCLTLVADTSLSGAGVARELAALLSERGKPLLVVSYNGTYVGRRNGRSSGITLHQNAFVESFNGRLRDV